MLSRGSECIDLGVLRSPLAQCDREHQEALSTAQTRVVQVYALVRWFGISLANVIHIVGRHAGCVTDLVRCRIVLPTFSEQLAAIRTINNWHWQCKIVQLYISQGASKHAAVDLL
eukprot:COSAG02_NODE_14010_length_1322_cov_1.094031_2_plen_114_part_01